MQQAFFLQILFYLIAISSSSTLFAQESPPPDTKTAAASASNDTAVSDANTAAEGVESSARPNPADADHGLIASSESVDKENVPPPPRSDCVPACREGFVCYRGMCVSACNPPCASGFECNRDAQCIPVSGSSSSIAALSTVREAQQQRISEIREHRAAVKAAYRSVLRLMISAQVALTWMGKDPDMAFLPRLGLGVRKNITDKFGFWAKGELVGGFQDNAYGEDLASGSSSTSNLIGFGAEAAVYGGPFRKFYVGSVFGFEGTFPKDDSIDVEYEDGTDDTILYEDRMTATYGVGMGILAGRKENINIHWRFSSAFHFWQMPFSFMFGVSYDLPLKSVDVP